MFNEEETKFLKEKMVTAVTNSSGKDKSMYMNILLKLNLVAMEQKGIVQPGKKAETLLESKSKVINFTNTNLEMVRNTVEGKLDELKKVGICGKVDSFKYTTKSAKAELQLFILDDNINVDDPNAVLKAEYNKNLQSLMWRNKGFKDTHFLKEFTYKAKTYQFIGFIPTGKKFIYKARLKTTGEIYKFDAGIEKLVL